MKRTVLPIIFCLMFTSSALAQLGPKHPNGHWSYPGIRTNPAGITNHLLTDHIHELKQSLDGLTIEQQQTLHDLIHIKRKTFSVHCVPYIAPAQQPKQVELKTYPVPRVIESPKNIVRQSELVLVNI